MNVINLSASGHLSVDGFADHLIIIFTYKSLYWLSVARRFLKQTHVPDPGKTHVQRTWYGSSSKCEYIHILLKLLYLFLMSNTEALLLIDNK